MNCTFLKTAVCLENMLAWQLHIFNYMYTNVPLESTTNETQSKYVSDVLDLIITFIRRKIQNFY